MHVFAHKKVENARAPIHNSVMRAKDWFKDFAKGSTLGTGILPGVSVGTVGIIVNVYDKLLGAIDGLRKRKTFWPSVFTLIPIGAGCLICTFLLLLFWDKVANPRFPFVIIAALAGFVIGALPLMLAELKTKKIGGMDVLRITLGFLFAAGIGICAYLAAAGIIPLNMDFSKPVDFPFQYPWIFILVFVVGFFSAMSCIVPGISGSMIMFIFGLYNPIVGLFFTQKNEAGDVVHSSIFHDPSKLGPGLLLIGALLLGMLLGFLLTSKFMNDLLEKHRHATFTVIIGFVLGSIVSMFFNNDMYKVYTTKPLNEWWQFLLGGIALVVTAVVTFFLIRLSSKRNKERVAQTPAESPAEQPSDTPAEQE